MGAWGLGIRFFGYWAVGSRATELRVEEEEAAIPFLLFVSLSLSLALSLSLSRVSGLGFRIYGLPFFAAAPAGFAVCGLLPVGRASGTEKYVKDCQKGHSRSFTYFWGSKERFRVTLAQLAPCKRGW